MANDDMFVQETPDTYDPNSAWTQTAQEQLNQQVNVTAGGGSGFDDFEFDAGGIDPDDFDRGGFIDKLGKYHLEFSDAKERPAPATYSKERGDIQITGTCLLTVKGQSPERSVITHWIEVPTAADRNVFTTSKGKAFADGKSLFDILMLGLCNFFLSAGVLQKRDGKLIDPETGSSKLNVRTFSKRIVGRQAVGNVVLDEYTDDSGAAKSKIKFHRYHPLISILSPESEGIPLNEEALKVAGIRRYVAPVKQQANPGNGNGQKPGNGAANRQQTSPPANVQRLPVASAIDPEL